MSGDSGSGDSSSATLHSTDPVLREFAELVGETDGVAVAGGRTRWSAGGELDSAARVIQAPSGIVDYVPEEMIVTVRAGTPVAELHAELAAKGQRTGLPERGGTVGGALAVGENDVTVLGRGTVRSALLQVRYVSSEGRIVNGGGPTVKNVTGFDLPRLMVGSLGTLGCLAEVIVRTNPIPTVSQWYLASDADPFASYQAVMAPSAVVYDGTNTLVLLEGHAVDVDQQAGELAATGSFVEVGPPSLPTGHRWSLPPAELKKIATHDTGAFNALVGVGTVWAAKPQPARTLSPEVQAVHDRMKMQFDPTGRLNPGRKPGVNR